MPVSRIEEPSAANETFIMVSVTSPLRIESAANLIVFAKDETSRTVGIMDHYHSMEGFFPFGVILDGYGTIEANTPFWVIRRGRAIVRVAEKEPANDA